jgi:hypothetical protein
LRQAYDYWQDQPGNYPETLTAPEGHPEPVPSKLEAFSLNYTLDGCNFQVRRTRMMPMLQTTAYMLRELQTVEYIMDSFCQVFSHLVDR